MEGWMNLYDAGGIFGPHNDATYTFWGVGIPTKVHFLCDENEAILTPKGAAPLITRHLQHLKSTSKLASYEMVGTLKIYRCWCVQQNVEKCESKWEASPHGDENQKCLEPPGDWILVFKETLGICSLKFYVLNLISICKLWLHSCKITSSTSNLHLSWCISSDRQSKTLPPICGERVNLFFAANSGLPPSNSHKWRLKLGFPTKNGIITVVTGILGGGAVPTASVKFLPKSSRSSHHPPSNCFSHLRWNKWCLQYTALGYSIHTTLAPSGWAALPI